MKPILTPNESILYILKLQKVDDMLYVCNLLFI